MYFNLSVLLLGFVLLHVGSNTLIQSSEKLALRFKLPTWLTSGLLLALGTSLPEVVVSITSSLKGLQALAISQVIGSNIANICLAMGLPWFYYCLKKYELPKFFLYEFIVIQTVFIGLLLFIGLNITSGIILLLLFIIALFIKIKNSKNSELEQGDFSIKDGVKLVSAIILVPLSSYAIVYSSEIIIQTFNLSEMFFGIIFIALGTSLPEIYSTFIAFKLKKYETAIMNVVGSNIINSTIVASVVCFMGGYNIVGKREYFDNGFMLAVALALFFILILKQKNKVFALLFILSYIGYLFSWV